MYHYRLYLFQKLFPHCKAKNFYLSATAFQTDELTEKIPTILQLDERKFPALFYFSVILNIQLTMVKIFNIKNIFIQH